MVDLVIAGSALVFALFFWLLAGQIPRGRVVAGLGASFWPVLLLGLLAFCAILLVIRTFRKRKEVGKDVGSAVTNNDDSSEIAYPHNFWVTLVLMSGYTYIMTIIGFVLATPLFIGLSSWIMGFRRTKFLVPISLLLSLALVYVFPKALSVPLPRGIGFFRTISLFFY